jgi:hypothetical protein
VIDRISEHTDRDTFKHAHHSRTAQHDGIVPPSCGGYTTVVAPSCSRLGRCVYKAPDRACLVEKNDFGGKSDLD